ncbi:MAG TPA: hypothetical protein VFK82_04040 [Burkholderiaceae bacterium]|nr:hypothetical protein [Burkholderiaceae bacterium]
MLSLAIGCASANSRVGEASVHDRGGVPCFNLPSGELARVSTDGSLPIAALFVSGVSDKASREVWAFAAYPPSSLPRIPSGECVRYGVLPAGIQAAAAQPLVPGRVYKVSVHAPLRNAGDSTRFFDQRFCVRQAAADQQPTVVVVPWDRAASRWRDDVCTGAR